MAAHAASGRHRARQLKAPTSRKAAIMMQRQPVMVRECFVANSLRR